MLNTNLSNYYYGDEAMQFSYFRILRQLITNGAPIAPSDKSKEDKTKVQS